MVQIFNFFILCIQIVEKLEEHGKTKVFWMIQPKVYEAVMNQH